MAVTISEAVAGLRLDMHEFEDCQTRQKFSQDIDDEKNEAERLGIRGTPTFLIGLFVNGKVQGMLLQGNHSFDVYRREIELLVNSGPGKDSFPGASAAGIVANDKPK